MKGRDDTVDFRLRGTVFISVELNYIRLLREPITVGHRRPEPHATFLSIFAHAKILPAGGGARKLSRSGSSHLSNAIGMKRGTTKSTKDAKRDDAKVRRRRHSGCAKFLDRKTED